MSDDDLPSSPPSLTHSPDNRHVAATKSKGRQVKAKPAPAMMATAELQALLPRRRTRRPVRTDRDVFDVESDEDEDADELSMVSSARTNRRTPAPAARNKQITKLKTAAKGKTRSYGKKSAPEADKENENGEENEEEDEDHSLAPISDSIEEGESSILDGKVGKELKKAKKKFIDVDKWEMEFESVTAEGSSQADAR